MEHRIIHMSSFSRSGETLMLRTLSAHPDIHVVHNLYKQDTPAEKNLFKFLMNYEKTTIPNNHEIIRQVNIKPGKILVLKNAVWTHKYTYDGFILARNPFSVVNSFKVFTEVLDSEAYVWRKKQYTRWAKQIDEQLVEGLKEKDHITYLCMLYNIKMFPLSQSSLPVVRYEEFVNNPEKILKDLCISLKIKWTDKLLTAHTSYKEGEIGHGNIKLWEPIHKESLHSYKKLPKEVLSKIYGLTYPTFKAFNYEFKDFELSLN